METVNSTIFSNTTGRRLEKLFKILPEVFFWTVIATRLFISVPLGQAAMKHFAFLKYEWLIITNSIVSVLIVESVLTLPSLSTAFFKRYDMGRYQTVAFWTTILLGMFNQSLIMLAWRDTDMGKEAFYMYTVFNVASIILAEFIGFMMQKQEKEQVAHISESVQQEGQVEIKERSITGATNDIAAILMLNLPESEKMFRLNEAGMSQREIAKVMGTNPTKVNTEIKRVRDGLDSEDQQD